jgi:hypothetical protein
MEASSHFAAENIWYAHIYGVYVDSADQSYTADLRLHIFCLQARPMTSNRGAGFSSNPRGRFDPMNQGKSALGTGTGSSLLPKKQKPNAEEVCSGTGRHTTPAYVCPLSM